MNRTWTSNRRVLLAGFAFVQIAAYVATWAVMAYHIGGTDPWPIVAMLGVILGQCALAAAFAVFAPWRISLRMFCSALVVVIGAVVLVLSDGLKPRPEDLLLISFFGLVMWLIIQAPLWLCRLFLRATAVDANTADSQPPRNQYGIRQLMALTLVVSLILGFGRLLLPAHFLIELKGMRVVDWVIFSAISVASGLIVSTTIVTSLHSRYWRVGICVSLLSSGLIAYGIYSTFNMLNAGSPPNERVHFAVMLLFTYGWLQLSALVLRASGYRITVGA